MRVRRYRRTLTVQTRYDARTQALERLGLEWSRYYLLSGMFGPRQPRSYITEKIWKKLCILGSIDDIFDDPNKDHLFFHSNEVEDSYSIECIQAVCEGKDNMFSIEHPLLSTYIRDNYDNEFVTVVIQTCTNAYRDSQPTRYWYQDPRRLSINGRQVGLDDRNRILGRVYFGMILKPARITTTRLKNGRFRDIKHWSLRALRLTPKKRTK